MYPERDPEVGGLFRAKKDVVWHGMVALFSGQIVRCEDKYTYQDEGKPQETTYIVHSTETIGKIQCVNSIHPFDEYFEREIE